MIFCRWRQNLKRQQDWNNNGKEHTFGLFWAWIWYFRKIHSVLIWVHSLFPYDLINNTISPGSWARARASPSRSQQLLPQIPQKSNKNYLTDKPVHQSTNTTNPLVLSIAPHFTLTPTTETHLRWAQWRANTNYTTQQPLGRSPLAA